MRQIFFLILLLFPYIAHSTDIKFKENLQNLPNEFFWDGLRFEKRTINDYEKDSEGLGYSAFYSGECSISLYIYDYNTYYFEETDVVGLKRYDDGKAPINLFNIPLETIHAYADIKKRLPDLEPRVPTFEEGFAYTPIFYKIKSEYKGQ